MEPALTWTRIGPRISLVGRIDENADLAQLAADVGDDVGIIDLSGLTRINSIGVREWMDFLKALDGRPLRLERCAPAFVEQLNAIANFAGDATIDSVLAAYECEDDSEIVTIEVHTPEVRLGLFPRTPDCPLCAREMLPAFEGELYYRFLRYTK